jgi:hypothetical protein
MTYSRCNTHLLHCDIAAASVCSIVESHLARASEA